MGKIFTYFLSLFMTAMLLVPAPVLAQSVNQKKLSRNPNSQADSDFERAREVMFEAFDVLREQGWVPHDSEQTLGSSFMSYELGETARFVNEELDLGMTAVQSMDEEFSFAIRISNADFSKEYSRGNFTADSSSDSQDLHDRFQATMSVMERQVLEARESEIEEAQSSLKLLDLLIPEAKASQARQSLQKGVLVIASVFVVSTVIFGMMGKINTPAPLVFVMFSYMAVGGIVGAVKLIQSGLQAKSEREARR